MARGLFWSKSISPTTVPSGDYIDTAEEDGLRIAGDVPVVDVTGGATTIKALDAGLDYVDDGVLGTGSTAVAAFATAFTATPTVVAMVDDSVTQAGVTLGSGSSADLVYAGAAAGSAVFMGVSGAGVRWIAYGDKY